MRLSVPYTGLILSTRERPSFRRELLELGISQISAGSKVNPGGYTSKEATEQFEVGDSRSLDEVVRELVENDFIPSFCTGCYRSGRVGKDFMDLAKPGLIKEYCKPNAMFTFREYLEDYASPETKAKGLALLKQLTQTFSKEELKKRVEGNLCKIGEGERDLYF